ncbi:hypothetical protein BCY84_03836 [Trypanosoma cruzi cruzi]|uniref:Uncharacterized protein n=1 Tax=Trypanosoma cruzi TaxID=5693 RepID=A0A2V2VBT1_TRYCR|nr:hypothetical protein BCY84_03836 [Trypanosoma cruzi cruzi]PWU93062.1 hypothetical protein C4B63_33g5 [Trypanosoma cruzi]
MHVTQQMSIWKRNSHHHFHFSGISSLFITSRLFFLLLLLLPVPYVVRGNTEHAWKGEALPEGVVRGPLLHEHAFSAPIVTDWWDEGVPHFMIGGSAVANEKFIRLTTNNLGDHGFAFNTAPCDHPSWEVRLRFSIRAPLPVVRARARQAEQEAVPYEGGEGMAIWYLEQPLGDDHQHVPKYSKQLDPDAAQEEELSRDPSRVADLLLNQNDDEDEDDDDEEEEEEKEEEMNEKAREKRRMARLLKQKEREELYRRVFKRGTSIDNSEYEPRILGLKFSEFKGFGVLLDSVGHREGTDSHPHHHRSSNNKNNNNNSSSGSGSAKNAPHDPRITLLFNLPAKERGGAKPAVNNFNPREPDFHTSPVRLQCQYDFRQSPTERAVRMSAQTTHKDEQEARESGGEALLHRTPEDPVELVVRYHRRRLSVIITREDVSRRRIVAVNPAEMVQKRPLKGGNKYRVEKMYVDTLCGEIDNVDLPLNYHFGVSASTGPRNKKHTERKGARTANFPSSPGGNPLRAFIKEMYTVKQMDMHVDVHDVISFELRELGKDAKAMGYSKSIPIEHFDYEVDRRERQHFSRQLPVDPEPDE